MIQLTFLLVSLLWTETLAVCETKAGPRCITEAEARSWGWRKWALRYFEDVDGPCFHYFGGQVILYFFNNVKLLRLF